jgi:putative tryptophan/tyrosine transport system substrate-binding protein
MDATRTIPIVMPVVADPVGIGLVTSLARPGGNVTGLTTIASDLSGKRLELLKEVVPGVSRIAVLSDPTNAAVPPQMRETRLPLARWGYSFSVWRCVAPTTSIGYSRLQQRSGPALSSRWTTLSIVKLAAKSRLPAMYGFREFVDAGGLMSYAANLADMYRRAATYVDKILKGSKPADLPVERPMKFEFVINLKAAKQIGLTIPPNVLARADKVIK